MKTYKDGPSVENTGEEIQGWSLGWTKYSDNFFTSMTFSFFLLYYLNISEGPNRK